MLLGQSKEEEEEKMTREQKCFDKSPCCLGSCRNSLFCNRIDFISNDQSLDYVQKDF